MQKYKGKTNLQNLFRLILNNIFIALIFNAKLLMRSLGT